jgi:hypothetical protein
MDILMFSYMLRENMRVAVEYGGRNDIYEALKACVRSLANSFGYLLSDAVFTHLLAQAGNHHNEEKRLDASDVHWLRIGDICIRKAYFQSTRPCLHADENWIRSLEDLTVVVNAFQVHSIVQLCASLL